MCASASGGHGVLGSVFILARLDEVRRTYALPPASALASASTFTLLFFKSLNFLNGMMDLVHIWYNDRHWSKVSINNILPWPIGHKGQKLGRKVKSKKKKHVYTSEGTVFKQTS